jgi:hypothetical protein
MAKCLFIRSGEMGGDNLVDGVVVERAPRNTPPYSTPECPIRTGLQNHATIVLDDGIRFGMSRADILHVLGAPSVMKGDVLDYRYSAPVPGCPQCEGIEGDLAFRFRRDAMTAMEVSKISLGK